MRCINYLSEYLVPVVLFYIVGFAVLQKRPVFDVFKLRRNDYLLFYVHHIAEQRHQKLIQRLIISHSFPSHPWFQRAKRQFTLPIIQYSVRQDN